MSFATIERFFPFMGGISFSSGAEMMELFQCKSDVVRHSESESAFDVIPFYSNSKKIFHLPCPPVLYIFLVDLTGGGSGRFRWCF